MHGAEVRRWGEEGVVVELTGEFDHHNLEDLCELLSAMVALRRPVMVDLSRVTFLDLGATRELAIRSRLYAHHLTVSNLSWQVRRSIAVYRFEAWLDPDSGVADRLTTGPGKRGSAKM